MMQKTTAQRGTKLLSWLLTLVMILSLLPMSALAAGDGVYVLMNIPYEKFYEAVGVTEDTNFDAITSATNKAGNYGKAGGAYHSGTTASEDEYGTITAVGGENGAKVEGVIWPVKVDSMDVLETLGGKAVTDNDEVTVATLGKGQTTYTDLTGYQTLTENKAYSYYVLDVEPSSCLTLDIQDGAPVFAQGTVTATEKETITPSVTYGSNWGDVQLDLSDAEDVANKQINAMVITAVKADSTGEVKAGFVHLANIWSYSDLAWRNENFAALNGATITNIRYYCNDKTLGYYVYDYPMNLELLPEYQGAVTAEFTSSDAITLSGLPADIANPKAQVYCTTGSGKNAVKTYLTPYAVDPADDDIDPVTVDIQDGTIAIVPGSVTNGKGTTQTYGTPESGTTYTIAISSDNYAPFTTAVTYSATSLTIDGKETESLGAIDFENIDLSNQTLFPNGAGDAYLVTIGEETQLLGDTSLKRWVGTWENWRDWIYPSEEMQARYPYLEQVWEQAYAAYIKAFEAAGMGEAMKARFPNVEALKQYWYDMTDTKGVASIRVEGNDEDGYLLSWLDSSGNVLASDSYTMTGKVLTGLEGAVMYVFTADNLDADSQYKYFVTMAPDMEGDEETPIAAHYHFQFGSDLNAILNNGELHNAIDKNETTGRAVSDMVNTKWYATMINANASDVAKYNVILGMHRADKWGGVLPGVSGENGATTYQPLFDCILKEEYNQYWHDYCAAVAGDNDDLEQLIAFLRDSCNGDTYGEENLTQYCCKFINDAAAITVSGNRITVKDADGKTISDSTYAYRGPVTVGDENTIYHFTAYLYEAADDTVGTGFKYFLFRDDTPASTYHIEFRYGDDLEALKAFLTGDYAYWLASGIPIDADETMIENCIALFCLENQDYSAGRSPESLSQITDLVGTWDYYGNGAAQHDTLYFTVDEQGWGTSYYQGEKSSTYQVYAYDNAPNGKSGVYAVRNEDGEITWADYAITVSGGKTFLTFTGEEDGQDYILTYVKHTSGSSGGSSSATYAVSASTGVANGSVTVSPKNAAKDAVVTITVQPDDGYVLDQLTVTDKNGAALQLTKKSDTQYTFVMPDSPVTVTASFTQQAETPASGLPFTDVPVSAYYYDAVAWAVDKGITTGTSADQFSPNRSCTRAQMVTFLWRAAGSPAPKGSSNPFTDVDASAYYYDAVQWAVEQGITTGTSASAFSPNAVVTRGQAVSFLWRASGSPAAGGENPFQDVNGSNYYAGAVQWASAQGITTGTSATTFSPMADCTRAQIVTFLWRSMK